MVSISRDRSSVSYTGNGTAAAFPFDFRVWEASQILVTQADAEGAESDITAQCSVSVTDTGGTVTLPAPLPQGWKLVVRRSMPFVQEDRYVTGTRFDSHEIEDALDIACAERQELRESLSRAILVPVTSDETPAEVLASILDTAAAANEYAKLAAETYREVVETAGDVEEARQSVELSKQSVDESERAVAEFATRVLDYSDELEALAANVEGIAVVMENAEAVRTLAADLQGYPIDEFDGGPITEPNQAMNGAGGVLRICAENIEDIRKVAESLDHAADIASIAADVTEIERTDYAAIAESGESGAV